MQEVGGSSPPDSTRYRARSGDHAGFQTRPAEFESLAPCKYIMEWLCIGKLTRLESERTSKGVLRVRLPPTPRRRQQRQREADPVCARTDGQCAPTKSARAPCEGFVPRDTAAIDDRGCTRAPLTKIRSNTVASRTSRLEGLVHWKVRSPRKRVQSEAAARSSTLLPSSKRADS
jgi:hypothetical protein